MQLKISVSQLFFGNGQVLRQRQRFIAATRRLHATQCFTVMPAHQFHQRNRLVYQGQSHVELLIASPHARPCVDAKRLIKFTRGRERVGQSDIRQH